MGNLSDTFVEYMNLSQGLCSVARLRPPADFSATTLIRNIGGEWLGSPSDSYCEASYLPFKAVTNDFIQQPPLVSIFCTCT